jgi:hypothetical protein
MPSLRIQQPPNGQNEGDASSQSFFNGDSAGPPPLPTPSSLPGLDAQLDDAFNGMLMAWYHSGYATGRYQAILELSQQQHYQQPPPQQQQQQQQQQYNKGADDYSDPVPAADNSAAEDADIPPPTSGGDHDGR